MNDALEYCLLWTALEGLKNQKAFKSYDLKAFEHSYNVFSGMDGTRTRDLLRDRQAF
jgi:hypothetical protein